MSFNTSLSGLDAAAGNLDAIANNIANASTTGFKKSRVEFADVYANASGGSGKTNGSGVLLNAVAQQFTQGQIAFTSNSLDLAISGTGFFVLNNNGTVGYSRSGAFGVDNTGNIANSSGERLTGFLADATGLITGARGDLQINTSNLAPLATSTIDITVNLDSSLFPPSTAFVAGFSASVPPAPDTYNSSTSTTIYDSLGTSHIVTSYFVKAHAANTWRVHVGVDGEDITPADGTLPASGASFGSVVAKPYTVVFDTNGKMITNSPTKPTMYQGITTIAGTLTPAGPVDISSTGTIPVLSTGDLILNGISVAGASTTADQVSTVQVTGSAISTADAINRSTIQHGVTATAGITDFVLGDFTGASLTLNSGDLVINGTTIPAAVYANAAALETAIDALTSETGVTATVAGTTITLNAVDGRNIHVTSLGTATNSLTLFDVDSGAMDKLQRAVVTLSTADNEGLVISGDNPLYAGFTGGTQKGIIYASSDLISSTDWNPGTGATSPQAFSINLSTATQFGASFAVEALSQNGYATGRLSSVEVNSGGVIYARYSNGQSLALGQVALANFSNVQGLSPLGNSSWGETFDSGSALIGSPGTSSFGTIQAGALEESNVDLSNELVSLIVAQRNFQANAQSIRTDDAVTQTIINIR
jgi:flagellar hook protein FlgE